MSVRLKNGLLILTAAEASPDALADWGERHAGYVFRLRQNEDGTLLFHSLGPEDEARRTPINITSKSQGTLRLISNFAETPFSLDGRSYQSVEGFWQGLKFVDDADRARLAALSGSRAKDAGYYAPKSDVVIYAGESVPVGTCGHWQLMEKACAAKFEQCAEARAALLATGTRPLTHKMRHDSRTIPGIVMADIWMRIRVRLQVKLSPASG